MSEPDARPILTVADAVEARDRLLRLGFTLAGTPTGESRYISVEDGRWLLGVADFLTVVMEQWTPAATTGEPR